MQLRKMERLFTWSRDLMINPHLNQLKVNHSRIHILSNSSNNNSNSRILGIHSLRYLTISQVLLVGEEELEDYSQDQVSLLDQISPILYRSVSQLLRFHQVVNQVLNNHLYSHQLELQYKLIRNHSLLHSNNQVIFHLILS